VSVQRAFAQRAVAGELAARLAEVAKGLRIGDPTLPDTAVGPLIREAEVQRVEDWVREAESQGTCVLSSGEALSQSTYACTVLDDPPPDARVSTEEVFGPVVCVYPFDDLNDAAARANALRWAFQAAVVTCDMDTAMQACHALDVSAVMINDHTAFRVDWMPFAGLRESGLGVGGIPYTLRDMQVRKLIVIH
jgi:acyl-CoA reductase-like NAD-dependent aldehyde dehydrogenase